jgi:hypothetical protein
MCRLICNVRIAESTALFESDRRSPHAEGSNGTYEWTLWLFGWPHSKVMLIVQPRSTCQLMKGTNDVGIFST